MDLQSNYSQTDAVKAISNILREPAPRSRAEPRETTACVSAGADSVGADLRAARLEAPARDDAGSPGSSTGKRHLRATLWRLGVLCVEPIFRRLREYLLEPLVLRHETHSAAVERLQLQIQLIRADLEVLPKQLVHLELLYRTLAAKQIAHLESQSGIFADQLKYLKSQRDNVDSRTEFSVDPVVLIGSGGHAKVVIELVRAEGKYQIKGCTGLGESGFVLGDVPILGTDNVLPTLLANGVKKAFVAIGDNHLRLQLLAQASEMGFELINAVSPDAVVSPSATLGRGIAIMAGAIINASAEIGDGAIINTNAGVDHDCRIGRGVHIGPGSALAGNVEIGCESFLGAGTRVIPGVRIGNRAIVGAGSVVVRDLPDGVTAMGLPARITSDVKTLSN